MEEFFKLLSQALRGEVSTPLGQINLAFAIILVAFLALLLTGHGIEQIGDFILRLFGKQGRPHSSADTKIAIISVVVFFIVSLVLVSAKLPASTQ